jgi:diadenosine tetraphosphate (Ap4A) HIT family hydrolase
VSCYTCEQESLGDRLPARELVAADQHWRVAHATGSSLPGWLVLVPRRHVTSLADLTDAEAAALGPWQVRVSRALREVTGCVKTYVMQFAEAPGFEHVHLHLVPRAADQPDNRRGPQVFGYLSDPAAALPDAELDAICTTIAAALRD